MVMLTDGSSLIDRFSTEQTPFSELSLSEIGSFLRELKSAYEYPFQGYINFTLNPSNGCIESVDACCDYSWKDKFGAIQFGSHQIAWAALSPYDLINDTLET